MNKKQLSAEKTRKLIISTAGDIISTEGSSGLTSRNLIDKAGISKGALYHHFDSLDDVVLAVIHEKIEQSVNQDKIKDFLESGPVSVVGFLKFVEQQLFRQIDGELDRILFEIKVLPKVIVNDYIRGEIHQKNSEWIEDLVKILDSGFSKSENRVLVALILSTASGLALKHVINGDRKDIRAQWALFKSMVLGQFCVNGH